jgi:hypothetical protein
MRNRFFAQSRLLEAPIKERIFQFFGSKRPLSLILSDDPRQTPRSAANVTQIEPFKHRESLTY